MSNRPLGDEQIERREPASGAELASEVGSSHGAPGHVADLGRALLCALLVSGCVAAPTSAPLFAPFAVALVGTRLVRSRLRRTSFLVTATVGSLAASSLNITGNLADVAPATIIVAVLMPLLLVPVLGLAHVRAARPDPAQLQPEAWPEPQLRTGFTLAVGSWGLALIVLLVAVLPFASSVGEFAQDQVRDSYRLYDRECREGGGLSSQTQLCENLLVQRDELVTSVGSRPGEVLGLMAALVVFGGAATTHLIMLGRGRRVSERIRPAWRLRELEVHWAWAYAVVLGVVTWITVSGGSVAEQIIRSSGAAIGVLGAVMIIAQGVGLAAWLLTRGQTPRWYRVVIIVISLFVIPATTVLLLIAGIIDQAIHPRRRVADSGSVSGSGSERSG